MFEWTGVWAQRVYSPFRSQTWLPDSGQLESRVSLMHFQGSNQSGQILAMETGQAPQLPI